MDVEEYDENHCPSHVFCTEAAYVEQLNIFHKQVFTFLEKYLVAESF